MVPWQTSSATPYKRSSAERDVRLARFDLRIIREKQPCVARVDTPECVAKESPPRTVAKWCSVAIALVGLAAVRRGKQSSAAAFPGACMTP